jgi:hypothetical protein
MKLLMVAFLVLSPGLFAQRGSGRSGGGIRGSGRMVAPGPIVGPVIAPYRAYSGYYPIPYYYGGGYATAPIPPDNGQGPAYYGDPANGQGNPAPGYPAPGYVAQGDPAQGYPFVIINPNYTPDTSNPVLRDYSYVPVPQAAPQDGGQNAPAATPSVIFLIAMKDHAIYPAIAYWVEDDTLNYISEQGVRNRVSLDLVDREFSTQLNKERSIDFGLPPAK